MVRVSPTMTGTLYACDGCPDADPFQELTGAQAHADATGHTLRPILEVRDA